MTAPAQSPAAAEVMAAFSDPSAVGGDRPAVRDFVGRVVVIKPTRYEQNIPNQKEPGKFQDRITADVYVLDGGPMEFGGNPTRGKPNTLTVATPYLVKDMYISNTNVVKAVRDEVGRGVVLGRVTRGKASDPMHNDPFNLVTLDPSDPARAMAGAGYQQVLNRVFVNPEPQKIGAAPAAPPAAAAMDPEYAAFLAAKAATAAPVQPVTPPVDPQYAAWKAQQEAAAAETPEQAAQRQFAAWQAEQAAKLAPTAPAEEIPEPPTGWDRTQWASLKPEQRTAVLSGTPPFK
jgi:hypothetical protein